MTNPQVTFARNVGFRKELSRRVNEYFATNNIRPRDNPAMYFKTVVITTWTLAAWSLILFGPPNLAIKILGCVALGMGVAGFGMSVGHDANHGGYSSSPLVNRIVGSCYDVIGVSSFLWRFRHNQLHHIYTNIEGYDNEIEGDGVVRMSPHAPHKSHHRWQHYWIWFIYPFIPIYWYFRDIQRFILNTPYQTNSIPTKQPIDYVSFWVGRVIGVSFFMVTPYLVGYSPLQIVLGFCIAYWTYGAIVCEIFMLAHVMEGIEFPQPDPDSNQIEDEWAIFQLKTTADFAPRNLFLNWYVGGLNYQAVHHLFPQICHIHYPKIAPIVEEVCQEFGVDYMVYPTFAEAIASNYRWLRLMAIGEDEVSYSQATTTS